MQVCIGILIGFFIGIVVTSILKINKKDAIQTIYLFKEQLEHERFAAIQEKKHAEYVKGVNRIVMLYKEYFKEELKNAKRI